MSGVGVAMLETSGQSSEITLSAVGAEVRGFLLPEDASRVRDEATSLLCAGSGREGKEDEQTSGDYFAFEPLFSPSLMSHASASAPNTRNVFRP